jgi:hypothetical protein
MSSDKRYREPLTAPCPNCARPCTEYTDPFGYFFATPTFACDNCERGDGVDSWRGVAVALGPLTFTLDESRDADLQRRFPTDPETT